MSDERVPNGPQALAPAPLSGAPPAAVEPEAAPQAAAGDPAGAPLDDLENLDFLLEEIENKIAPLALA